MEANKTGKFISELRRELSYTQKELAEKLSVSDKAVSRWETGKGLPDTSLLKPLSDILGVTVTELLSGERLSAENIAHKSDSIVIDAMKYSGKMLKKTLGILFIIIGAAFLISPLFLAASFSIIWVFGIILILFGVVFLLNIERDGVMKRKALHIISLVILLITIVLESLPYGVVLNFADGPENTIINTFSYFSLTPFGYANFTPLLTGFMTIAVTILTVICILQKNSVRTKNAAFICNIIAAFFSVVPFLLFGASYMNILSWCVTLLLLISCGTIALGNIIK